MSGSGCWNAVNECRRLTSEEDHLNMGVGGKLIQGKCNAVSTVVEHLGSDTQRQ